MPGGRAGLLVAALALVAACTREAPPTAAEAGPSPEAQRLLDESEIRRLAAALDDAVDRKDWTQARLYFADEVDVDFSSLGGAPGRVRASEMVDNWQKTLTADKPSFHLRGGDIVSLNGDAATLSSHGYVWNRITSRKTNDLWEVWGVWEYSFARTPQGWRISGLKFVKTYERGDPEIRTATQ
jgi:hypothetical protein